MEESAALNGGETVGQLSVDLDQLLCHGLTKREHLASLAMQGLLSRREDRFAIAESAGLAVQYADALLLALETVKP